MRHANSLSPYMTPAETALLVRSLHRSQHYFEYGVGGSTVKACEVAATNKTPRHISGVDTDKKWITYIRRIASSRRFHFEHVDVGPVEKWGYPRDRTPREASWKKYSTAIHRCPSAARIDLVLIDGRFRVACFIQSILSPDISPLILLHDYASRPEYHVVERWADIVELVDDLVLLRRKPALSLTKLRAEYERRWQDLR